MLKLSGDAGDPEVRAAFAKTMEGGFDQASKPAAFPPLESFVMELFRTISPNGGSISAIEETQCHLPAARLHGDAAHQYEHGPAPLGAPGKIRSDAIPGVPTSHDVDEARAKQIGFAKCPFARERFEVKDGRKASLNNSAFGTVYGMSGDKAMPVCDYAGFAPFGFGYRRCPGEQLTIAVFEDFLRKAWKERIEFVKLNIADPEPLPIGPTTVIGDNVGFVRTT